MLQWQKRNYVKDVRTMKTFIAFVPQQPEGRLNESVYEPQGNPRLTYGPTCFPIIPVINGYTDPGDEIHMILVVPDYENCRYNEQLFRKEFEALCAEKNLRCNGIDAVSVPYDDAVGTHIATFQALIDRINDNDDLHACVTFGSKPSPMVELMALRYARRIKQNTFISCIVYGQFDHMSKTSRIYDETALCQLDDIVQTLADMGDPNPRQTLDRIITL